MRMCPHRTHIPHGDSGLESLSGGPLAGEQPLPSYHSRAASVFLLSADPWMQLNFKLLLSGVLSPLCWYPFKSIFLFPHKACSQEEREGAWCRLVIPSGDCELVPHPLPGSLTQCHLCNREVSLMYVLPLESYVKIAFTL